MATAQKPRISLGGLAPLLDIDQLDDAPTPAARSQEAPRMALDLIDEDPNQPRTDFDPVALQELADSIQVSGGVKSPVSLRPHPTAPGRYMLNFGARRLRASRMLGLADIPYFIDRKVDSFDQVIENEQRSNLTAIELALFIKARLAEGMEQQEIARRLGKSKALVSKHASLIDAPDVVMDALRTGKAAGANEAYELRRLHADHPQAVEQWAAGQDTITRSALTELRQRLSAPAVQPEVLPVPAAVQPAAVEAPVVAPAVAAPSAAAPAAKPAPAKSDAGQTAKASPAPLVLVGEYKGQRLELDLSARPAVAGHVFGRRPGSSRRLTVPAAEVRLVGFATE